MDASQLIARKHAKQLQLQKQAQKVGALNGTGQPNSFSYPDSSSLLSAVQGLPLIESSSSALQEKKKKFEEELKKENENTILVLLLGDGLVSTLEASLREAHNNSEYSTKQLRTTSMILTKNYTGNNLQNYDVVIFYTKNKLMFELNANINFNNMIEEGNLVFHEELGKSLNSYVAKGGNLIMSSFCWGEDDAIPYFDYNLYSPFQYGGLSRYLDSYNVDSLDHPILKKNDKTFSILVTETPLNVEKILTTIKLSKGSQCIAKISENIPFIAIKENNQSRIVAINSYVSFPYSGKYSKPILINIIYRSILWCKRILG